MSKEINRFKYIGTNFFDFADIDIFYDTKTRVMYMSYDGLAPIVAVDADGKPCLYTEEKLNEK